VSAELVGIVKAVAVSTESNAKQEHAVAIADVLALGRYSTITVMRTIERITIPTMLCQVLGSIMQWRCSSMCIVACSS
jgi:anti-sigma factor ChrR (cupin superfamily)